ncbi:Mas-related G-protein coupled receptor member H, partial [Ophiophagus hannah]
MYNTSDSYKYEEETDLLDLEWIIWRGIILITCCIGFVGNGYIIWLLGFQIKRNCFTTFILNLAIADFGYLTAVFIYYILPFTYFWDSEIFHFICAFFFYIMYISSNFLLTAISIDRCVAVLFPIWHRCSRPKHLSSSVCALLWISSFLLCGIMSIMGVFVNYSVADYHFLVSAIVCLPLITLSTTVLFIKVCLKSNQQNQGRLLLMILITLLCFLILAFPLSVLSMIVSFSSTKVEDKLEHWVVCSILFSCLNSSINPVIYFLVGRKKGTQTKESIKVILQKVFKEDLHATKNYYNYNNTNDLHVYAEGVTPSDLGWNAWISISLITCCFGFVGNGYIIWLLGFQIKRNCFTTFVLNLAIADFGYLTSMFIYSIITLTDFQASEIFYHFDVYFTRVMFINANFLLTAVSMDRCMAVIFPIWHRCSRPKHLSSSICVLLWISSFLLSGIMSLMQIFVKYKAVVLPFFLIAIVCLPLITLSTVVLFIKVCLKPNQKNQGRLLLIILITLLCFLILAFPLCVFAAIITFSSTKVDNKLEHWTMCSIMFSCINSSVNPVIYFIVGRKKGAQSKESMKVILQKVFKEAE